MNKLIIISGVIKMPGAIQSGCHDTAPAFQEILNNTECTDKLN